MTEQEEFEFRRRYELEQAAKNNTPTMQDRVKTLATTGRDTLAGALRGVAGVGATIISPIDMMLGNTTSFNNPERKKAIDSGLKDMGVNTDSSDYAIGKFGGEMAGTAGAGGLIGNGLTRIPAIAAAAPNLLKAIASNGLTAGKVAVPEGAGALTRAAALGKELGTRAAGGSIAGGASAGLVNPEDIGYGAAIGGAVPLLIKGGGAAGNLAGGAGNKIVAALSNNAAKKEAVAKIAGDAGEETNALIKAYKGQTAEDIPVSLSAVTQDPRIARLEQASRVRNPELWNDFTQNQGAAVYRNVLGATKEAEDLAARKLERSANWNRTFQQEALPAVDQKVYKGLIDNFTNDLEKAKLHPASSNKDVRNVLDEITKEISRVGDGFSPEHLQVIRSALNGKRVPQSANAYEAAPRESPAIISVMKEMDDILNKSTGGKWQNVLDTYTKDSKSVAASKAAQNIRSYYADKDTGRILGKTMDVSGETPIVTEAGLGKAMNSAREPKTKNLMLSKSANDELNATLGTLREQGMLDRVKRASQQNSDTAGALTSLLESKVGNSNLFIQAIQASRKIGMGKTDNEIARLLTNPSELSLELERIGAKSPEKAKELMLNPLIKSLMATSPITAFQNK